MIINIIGSFWKNVGTFKRFIMRLYIKIYKREFYYEYLKCINRIFILNKSPLSFLFYYLIHYIESKLNFKRVFIDKERLLQNKVINISYSSYCISLATNIFYLSCKRWILWRKSDSSFEAIIESIHYCIHLHELKCWSKSYLSWIKSSCNPKGKLREIRWER